MPKSNRIKLSKKHGLNPTIPLCFWCGKEKNEIALLGKIKGKGDPEAPRNAWLGDYDPCDECGKLWMRGIVFIEARDIPVFENQPKYKDAYPTGKYLVMTEQGVRKLIQPESLVEDILKRRMCFIDEKTMEALDYIIGEGTNKEET